MALLSSIKSAISQRMINIPGYRTKDPILLIESDDWGSIRMPTIEVYDKFVDNGFSLADSDYNRLDTLESNDDLTALFEVLTSHTDGHGNHPVITANTITGNPDFIRIKESDFQYYYFENVITTIENYKHRDKVEELWKEGISQGIYRPQFHGREHVNVIRWMEALRKRTPEIMYAFDNKTTFSGEGDYNFMEVLDYNSLNDLNSMKSSLKEGLDMFEDLFGYRSKSFIPPCYAWDSNIEDALVENGVKYIQGLIVQSVPTGKFGEYKRKYHYMGSKNKLGLTYLTRNCFFEPSLTRANDPVGDCLKRIDLAFKWRKPAIISSHRINFIGSLVESNRTQNLKFLDDLLAQVLKKWPNVQFLSTDQLGDRITDVK